MKFCPSCGSQVNEGNQFCHSCGEKLSQQQQPQPQYQTNQDYTYSQQAVPEKKVSIKNSIISFILGLVNIELAFCCIFPIACFIFFPGCIILSIFGLKTSKKYVKEAGKSNAFAKIGKILAIVSLVIACIFFIFGLILTFAEGAALDFYAGFLQGFYGEDFYNSVFGDTGSTNTNGGLGGSYYAIL